MEFEEEYQTLRIAKESVKAKTAELAEAIARVTLAEDALEECLNEPIPGRMKSFISEEARRLTAEKALHATVLRLLQRRPKNIPD